MFAEFLIIFEPQKKIREMISPLFSPLLLPFIIAMFLAVNMGGSGTGPSFSVAYGANVLKRSLIPGLLEKAGTSAIPGLAASASSMYAWLNG